MHVQKQDGTKITIEEWKKARENLDKSQRPVYSFNMDQSERKTAGQTFVESNAYKHFIENSPSSSDAVPFKKAVGSRTAGGDLLGEGMYLPTIIGGEGATTTMRDLLNVQPTTNNAIYYMENTGYTNAAVTVAEQALKPQSDMTFEERMALVRTIAHWLPVTNQALADITGLQNYIDTQLLNGLRITEESQLLYGSGTGEDLTGLMVHAGVQDAGGLAGGTTMIDHVRHAITLSSLEGDIPNGIILNPLDWEDIELLKDTTGRYIIANVATGGEQRLWRVPVVVSSAMTAGSFLTGAFNTGATIFDREQATIKISDSHADYFTRNMKAVLCEERIAFAIQNPAAFVKGTFTPAV